MLFHIAHDARKFHQQRIFAMHDYRIPEPRGKDVAELNKMRDISDAFNAAAINAFSKDPAKIREIGRAMTRDEVGTMKGIASLVKSNDGRDGAFELLLTLQFNDLTSSVLTRVDPSLAQSAVPAVMATAEAADLFKKHDLPTLEKLARSAIKPGTP